MQQTVLITGGAGSLGRAFVRLLASKGDYHIIVVDSNEWAVAEMRSKHPHIEYSLLDFADYPLTGMEDYIIHAAAFKHVDLGEQLPRAFVTNNLTKTIKFYEKVEQSIAKLLYISTDKAVEPINVYGATKYIAEALTREINGSVARLGNILGSSGSVIPVWEAQIAAKEPITITDERMSRYVIDDADAVNQIWHEFLKGESLIIPKMEAPVRIMDMLAEVLKRHGYNHVEDYTPGVTTIGMRKGEKLAEKLTWDHE
jgi:FlaA1/EpsC-like NDP-sugar epimerase